jgi:hypothetical protein
VDFFTMDRRLAPPLPPVMVASRFFFDQGNRRGGLYGNFLLMTKKITRKEAWGIYMSGCEKGRSYNRKTKFKKDQSTQIRLLCVWV